LGEGSQERREDANALSAWGHHVHLDIHRSGSQKLKIYKIFVKSLKNCKKDNFCKNYNNFVTCKFFKKCKTFVKVFPAIFLIVFRTKSCHMTPLLTI
jgi:hypothetical protein